MKDSIDRIVERNEPEFNYLKLLEELAELTEVVIKRHLKQPKYKPAMAKIVEEAGDVILRLKIFCRMEGIAEEVNKRVLNKLAKLENYIETNEFKNV